MNKSIGTNHGRIRKEIKAENSLLKKSVYEKNF